MRCWIVCVMGALAIAMPRAVSAGWLRRAPVVFAGVSKIWVLPTSVTGEMNSRLAIAEKFLKADIKTVAPSEFKNEISRYGYPDLIVHSFTTESESEMILAVQRKSRGQTYVVNIEDPGPRRREYDLILNADFNPPIVGVNVLKTFAVPSRVNPDVVELAREEWAAKFAHLARPILFVIVGGQTVTKTFTTYYARDLSQRVTRLVRETGGSLVVTNSRRTTEPSTRAFLSEVSGVPFYFYDWRTSLGINNPYLGLLAFADYIVATGDSMSMLSDVTQTGKPVFVYAPETTVEERHQRFILNLYRAGRVRPFQNELADWTYTAPDTAQQVFRRIERDRNCGSFLTVGSF